MILIHKSFSFQRSTRKEQLRDPSMFSGFMRARCEFVEGLERRRDVKTFEKSEGITASSGYRPRSRKRR